MSVPGTTIRSTSIIAAKKAALKSCANLVADNHEIEPPHAETPLDEAFIIPTPGHREVSGDVRRKASSVSKAHSPPSSQPQAVLPFRGRRDRQPRRSTGSGDNNNDDSDSDADSTRRRQEHEDSVVRRRTRDTSDLLSIPDLTQTQKTRLEKEERERTQQLRYLRDVGEKWNDVRHLRGDHHRTGLSRRQALSRRHDQIRRERHADLLTRTGGLRQEPGELKLDIDDPAWLCSKEVELTEFEAKRQIYLDLVLCGNIEEQRMDDLPARTPSVSLEELLLNVERGVVDRCILGRHTEGPLQRDYYRPRNLTSGGTFNMKNRENFNVERKLLLAILEIYQDLWNSCYLDTTESMDQNDTVNDAADFVKTYFNEGATFNWVANPLIDHYITRLSQDLADAAARRVDPEQVTQGGLPIVSILNTSSFGGHLSQTYSNWTCLGFPAHEVADLSITWDRIRKIEKCDEYRKTMASANIRQEFCFGIHTPGVVSVVLFKGDLPATITDVDPSVLEKIGWFPVSPLDRGLGYWQYDYCSPYSLANKQAEKVLFRVTMDNEVLGMYLPNGEWLAWEEKMEISTHRMGSLM